MCTSAQFAFGKMSGQKFRLVNFPTALFAFGKISRSKVRLGKFTKCILCVWESFRGSEKSLGEISGVSNFRLG